MAPEQPRAVRRVLQIAELDRPAYLRMRIPSLFRSMQPVPGEYRSSFLHLYLDLAWFGVLAASATAFVAVYAARQGASAFQIGLLSAGPAMVNLVFTLPAGRWLERQPVHGPVFWTAVFHRAFYLLWVPLPMLLSPQPQIWALVAITLVMSIPGTALAVGFNALFADAVPPEWRGHVAGVRNALLAIVFIVVSLLCGYILDTVTFPLGYQIVFALGFVGATMSTVHLWFLAMRARQPARPRVGRALGDLAWPGTVRTLADAIRPGAALRFLVRPRLQLRTPDLLRGPFGRLLAILFAFYLSLHLAIPLFPLHWVENLHLSDQEIGLGTAVFYVSVFLGSIRLEHLVRRFGNQRVTAIGAMLMSSYPAFLALAHGLGLFLVGSAAGGLGWSLLGGALTNYVLERIPAGQRPAHLAWYNLVLNAGLLSGSLLGPVLAGALGLPQTLAVSAALRFLMAVGILLWA
jgi:MFS family permease